jgi:serine/threonine-protein kinase
VAKIKPRIILIDDEERILRSLSMLLQADYSVMATSDPQAVLRGVASERVHLVVADQRMPLMRGADLLREVRLRSPGTMRVLLTGYSDMEALVASINEGEIFRFVPKPWDARELVATVRQATQIALATMGMMPAADAAAPAERAASPAAVLVIDEDAEVHAAVRSAIEPQRPVLHSKTVMDALHILEHHEVGVVVSEIKVAGESTIPMLQQLKIDRPEVVSLVLSPFEDADAIVRLINQGQIHRLLRKPLRSEQLGPNLAGALRYHRQLRAMPELVQRHAVDRRL